MANDALERVRKGLRKELKPSQSRTLKGDRKILLKRAHEVSDRERLIMETWTGAFPQLRAAYEHKERRSAERRGGEALVSTWRVRVSPVYQQKKHNNTTALRS